MHDPQRTRGSRHDEVKNLRKVFGGNFGYHVQTGGMKFFVEDGDLDHITALLASVASTDHLGKSTSICHETHRIFALPHWILLLDITYHGTGARCAREMPKIHHSRRRTVGLTGSRRQHRNGRRTGSYDYIPKTVSETIPPDRARSQETKTTYNRVRVPLRDAKRGRPEYSTVSRHRDSSKFFRGPTNEHGNPHSVRGRKSRKHVGRTQTPLVLYTHPLVPPTLTAPGQSHAITTLFPSIQATRGASPSRPALIDPSLPLRSSARPGHDDESAPPPEARMQRKPGAAPEYSNPAKNNRPTRPYNPLNRFGTGYVLMEKAPWTPAPPLHRTKGT